MNERSSYVISAMTFSEPSTPLEVTRSPDKVLVIGATGHVGRIFLEQGLDLFADTEFRVLLRNVGNAKNMPPGVDCRAGDVCDVQSIRAACEGLTSDSLIFDSVTQIALNDDDEDGSIAAINLQGVINVVQVAQELGCTLHKAHSNGGLPCPREGAITERTPPSSSEEEAIYARLPYLKAKKEATKYLLRAHADGLRATVSYLPSPIGPASRADAIFNGLVKRYVKTRNYFFPEGVDVAYVDARDAAKAHWVAFMNEIHDDFILSNNASSTEIMDSFERVGLVLKGRPLKFKTVVALGRLLDFLKKWILRKAEFPLSEATAYLMFANMAYSSAKAQKQLGFKPRPVRDTFSDHFQDLIHRGVIEVDCAARPPSIW